MRKRKSNWGLFIAFAAITGALIAIIVWLFLKISNVGITIIWDIIPDAISFKYYTIVMCLVGGLIIGIFHQVCGGYPEPMKKAVIRFKNEGGYPYRKIPVIIFASFLSLFFGGAVGPEAGLVGILLGLCCWAKDQFGMARYQMDVTLENDPDMSRLDIFKDMVADLFLPADEIVYDKRIRWTRAEQVTTGVTAGVSGLAVYIVLNAVLGSCITIPHLEGGAVSGIDKLLLIVLLAAGILAGYLYHLFHKSTAAFFSRLEARNLHILNAVLGGLILGLVGSVLPMTMFSGGNDIQVMEYEYLQYTPVLLIVIGVVKLFLTNVCIQSGWKGGHFFPVIFSGISIGYGMSLLLGTNQILSVTVLSSALLATIIQQPVGSLVLGLIFFPVKDIGWICLASAAGGCIPLPAPLRTDAQDKGFIYKIVQKGKMRRLSGKEPDGEKSLPVKDDGQP